ncbi:Receptor expression-enhancing protein 6 [Entophlyctis luteolus]|nr:Receptor expression-enhancing protein 6 [Entophlyctis luteolus]
MITGKGSTAGNNSGAEAPPGPFSFLLRPAQPDATAGVRTRPATGSSPSSASARFFGGPKSTSPRANSVPVTFPGRIPASIVEDETIDDGVNLGQAATVPNQSSLPISAMLLRLISRNSRDLGSLATGHLTTFVSVVTVLEKYAHSWPALLTIYGTTDVPPLLQMAGFLLVVAAVFRRAMKTHARLVSNLTGAVYPGVMSVLAVERPRENDDETFHTYWSVFGLFSIIDEFSQGILSVFPAYFSTKMAVLYWMFARGGAQKVYRNVYRPLLAKYSQYMSSYLSDRNGNQ